MDSNRLEQFTITKRVYDTMPQKKEFIIPTREIDAVRRYLRANKLSKDVRLIPYEVEKGFNCSKALNIGVRQAKYDRIVITSPEVKPTTDVLAQFEDSPGVNIVTEVSDEDINGSLTPLVTKYFRGENPGMYFLACFNKADIETINGWDEDFMKGYAYEDNDFGDRWVRAGLPFEIREDIRAVHQYHPRSETVPNGFNINARKYNENNERRVIRPINGLIKL